MSSVIPSVFLILSLIGLTLLGLFLFGRHRLDLIGAGMSSSFCSILRTGADWLGRVDDSRGSAGGASIHSQTMPFTARHVFKAVVKLVAVQLLGVAKIGRIHLLVQSTFAFIFLESAEF
ncbi:MULTISPECIES: hypothetical protein [unclassified Rhizobium]|jgi:hypothetical protein|uniref:hypothetical protein n=1 Tax=unclassified Rhizobium TaxID=2613769 RepID=UPI00064759E2|nr:MULTISPECIES: hypothetical protein [unclassified Rhizobium]MBN8950846.1 hypothetical protein [Rhizobium tropici]OJY66369.1 MAG: hypothetical protein BGP09_31020 [Rhizobium sp. 60-20]